MKSLITALAVLLITPAAFAQSAKNGVATSQLTLVPAITSYSNGNYVGDWRDVLSANIQTSQQKDLVIGTSLEVGLFTDTMVSSQKGTKDTSRAEAQVQVRVVIDKGTPAERIAEPGVVTFNRRTQELIASFGGVLDSCTDSDLDGTITLDDCTFTDETLQLMLETLSAHTFFFALDDLGTGTHTVHVQARVSTGTYVEAGSASASAWVGKGSVVLEEIRLVKGTSISL